MKSIQVFRRRIQAKTSQKILKMKMTIRYVINNPVGLMKKTTKMMKFRIKTMKMIRD